MTLNSQQLAKRKDGSDEVCVQHPEPIKHINPLLTNI